MEASVLGLAGVVEVSILGGFAGEIKEEVLSKESNKMVTFSRTGLQWLDGCG